MTKLHLTHLKNEGSEGPASEAKVPNQATKDAMIELETGNTSKFASVEELMASLQDSDADEGDLSK